MENRRKQIIFFEPWPTVMVYKIAKLFKKNGYEAISVRILEGKSFDNFFQKGFDKIISFDLEFFKLTIKNIPLIFISFIKKIKNILKVLVFLLKSKPYVVFARTQPNWPCALIRVFFRNTPLIYFPYDIRAHEVIIGKIGENIRPGFESKAELFCFKHTDGIMHKGAPEELDCLKQIEMTPLQLSFLPYCSQELIVPLNKNKLSKKDKEIHMVNVSSIGSVGPALFLLDYAREFAKHKIHFHFYAKPNTLTKEKIMKEFSKAYADVLDSKYFHIETPLDPKNLAKDLSKYDYGLMIENTRIKLDHDSGYRFLTGNKISSYFEAGIPFFYCSGFEFVDRLTRKYGVQMHLDDEKGVQKLPKIIKKHNYKQLEKNILKARKDFLMEKNFPRLENFVKAVVRKKRLK